MKPLIEAAHRRSFKHWTAQFGGLLIALFFASTASAQSGSAEAQLFEKAKAKIVAKCAHFHGPANLCLLTEQDLIPNGRPDRYLFFRGESKPRKSLATSAYARWASSKTGPCKNGCTAEELTKEFTTDLSALPMYQASTRLFRTADRSWRLTYQTGTALSPQAVMLNIIQRHIIGYASPGSDLTIDNTGIMFDPFISFSSSPLIAENFAGAGSPGVVMIISVPKDKVIKTSDNCEIGNFDATKIYDLYPCFGAAGSIEGEYDAYLSLPKEYIYSVYTYGDGSR